MKGALGSERRSPAAAPRRSQDHAPAAPLDVERLRADFPILSRRVRGGKPLVYLDNAATAQKPRQVIEALARYYAQENANIHRGVHELSEQATLSYERARETVQRFVGAAAREEIVFTRGTTESINLVASAWGRANLRPGDEVLITELEHHSNIVPWQLVCQATGARVVAAPVDDRGEILVEDFRRLLGPRTRMAAFAHVSNSLGTVNPVRELVALAGAAGALTLVDGAQAVAHGAVDVRDLGCDFYAFSGHKVFGPTGIGVLYGRKALLEALPPYQGGGGMIAKVTIEETTWAPPPERFEAGTPHIAGALGLAAALDFLEGIGLDRVQAHERALLARATERLAAIRGLRLIGTAARKEAILSFTVEGIHPHDLGTCLDREGVAIRAGHHCTQPLMRRFGLVATARASLACYNTLEEIEVLVRAIERAQELFR